ncbi:WcaA Glycosyltransferases involved in cell wall biogenesis [Candidatus Nanopelagicaceae bacterium]
MSSFNIFKVSDVEGVPDYIVKSLDQKRNKTALLIPVLNEGTRILLQLKQISQLQLEVDVIVADGGSIDGLEAKIGERDLNVNTFLSKIGSGALSSQIRMGFHYCLSQKYECVITMDGNNKDDPSGVIRIQEALNSGMDFVQGSRFIRGGQAKNTPVLRYLAIRLVHAPLTSLAAKFWYTDTTNGFRGHSIRLLKNPKIEIFREKFNTYELLAYLPIRSRQIGLKVCEVPVTRMYPLGVAAPTKIHGIGAQLRLFFILMRAVLGRYNPQRNQ